MLKENLKVVSEEIMIFMRSKYMLDEIGNHKDELKFRQGKKTILTIYIKDDYFDFLLIFGKQERTSFESKRNDFPTVIQEIYDNSRTYHDGKWMTIKVNNLAILEAVKKMIMIKKKPNRKPFDKNQAVYSSCGHRCDMCVHYTGDTVNEELRKELKERLIRVYANGAPDGGYWGDDMQYCDGCHTGGISKDFTCDSLKCAKSNTVNKCQDCLKYPCKEALQHYQGLRPKIHTDIIFKEDVTKIILPYVYMQYGN